MGFTRTAGRENRVGAVTPRPGGYSPKVGGSGAQAQALGALDGLGPVADPELAVERARVLLDGVRRKMETVGDLLVGGARGHQLDHLALAAGEGHGVLLVGSGGEHRHSLAH